MWLLQVALCTAAMKIKFGPHADKEVADLPIHYIKYLLYKVRIRDTKLLKELKDLAYPNGEEPGHEDPRGNWK